MVSFLQGGAVVTLVTGQFSPKNIGQAAAILTALGVSAVIFASIVDQYLY